MRRTPRSHGGFRVALAPMTHFEPENGVSDGLTEEQLLETLGIASGAWGDYRHWGAIPSHRQACVRYLRNSLFALLDDPKMTRGRLKQEFRTVAKRVEEHGPPDARRNALTQRGRRATWY